MKVCELEEKYPHLKSEFPGMFIFLFKGGGDGELNDFGTMAQELYQLRRSNLTLCCLSQQEPRGDKATEMNCWIARERQQLLQMTEMLDEHPENYEGPCNCELCKSYGD